MMGRADLELLWVYSYIDCEIRLLPPDAPHRVTEVTDRLCC